MSASRWPSITPARFLFGGRVHGPIWRILAAAIILASPCSQAQSPETSPDTVAVPAIGLPDSAEVGAFLDGMIEAQLVDRHIVGATVSVVKGGRLFLAKGYGYADRERKRRVDPATTLFRVGSISKLFVWTAVMQLVEQGKIDLGADVNTYLGDVRIPDAFGRPVTMNDLMTHTAGFEDWILGLFGRDSTSLAPLSEILTAQMPGRVWAPGETPSYSNHGTGLAALIVERVSGEDWQSYVERHILHPLAMTHTTFRQPVPAGLRTDLSFGYAYRDGDYEVQPFEYVPLAPVGAASATATDMARFALAHLQLGRLDTVAILDPEVARTMQQPLYRPAEGVNAMAHGFIDASRNGHYVIGHGGDTFWFHSMLAFIPEAQVAVFISFNTDGGGGATGPFLEAFLDRFFPPVSDAEPPDVELDPDSLERYAGFYRANRYPHQRVTRIAALMSTVQIKVDSLGHLEMHAGDVTRWRPIGDHTFADEYGRQKLVFRVNAEGEIMDFFVNDLPIIAFERVGVLDRPDLQGGLLVVLLTVLFLAVVCWPIAAIVQRWSRREIRRKLPAVAIWVAWTGALLLLAFVIGLAVLLMDPLELAYGAPAGLRVLLWLPLAACVFAAVGVLLLVWIMFQHKTPPWRRWIYAGIVAAQLICLWQLAYWNMVGFKL